MHESTWEPRGGSGCTGSVTSLGQTPAQLRLDQSCQRDRSFLCHRYSLGAVLQCGEVSDVIIQRSHSQDMLLHISPLVVLAHCLLYVELLPFCCISSEDGDLMQLKTELECSPQKQMPSCGHLTIHSSPRVTLVHLVANVIPLGLRITRQEIPQLLIRLGSSLVMSLPSFFEHLLDFSKLQLVGLLVFLGTCTLGLIWLLEIL
jgi:hypothetical protein